MNIVNRLTYRHLKENKGRTIVTTMGIAVSVAMITAVFVSAASILNFYGELSLLGSGNIHLWAENVSTETVEKLKSDERIRTVGTLAGDRESFVLNESVTDRKGIGDIRSGDAVYFQQLVTGEYEGKLPEREGEIAVERSLITDNHLDWQVGDVVRITTGIRYLEINGSSRAINGRWVKGETFEAKGPEEYKVTAILHDNPSSRQDKILRFGLPQPEKATDAAVTMKNTGMSLRDEILSVVEDYQIGTYLLNDDYLDSRLSLDPYGIFAMLIPVIVVLLIIIMTASVLLIYNSFGMSLAERVRYLGMLSSVGATRKQRRLSVYYEGILLGLVGIPLGILSGVAGIAVTLRLVSRKILETSLIPGAREANMGMHAVVPLWVVLGAVIFSGVTIGISSLIPAVKASLITPIDAIRQSKEIKIKKRNMKAPRSVRMIFGYEGELAYKNLKRNGRKARNIAVSIGLSFVLFFGVNYFCELFMRVNGIQSDIPYQVQIYVANRDKAALKDMLTDMTEVSQMYELCSSQMEEKSVEKSRLFAKENLTGEYKNAFNDGGSVIFNILEDEEFRKMCSENQLDADPFFQGEVKGILLNNLSRMEKGAKLFNEAVLGTALEFTDYGTPIPVTIERLVDYREENSLYRVVPPNMVALYVPASQMASRGGEKINTSYCIETEEPEKLTEKIGKKLEDSSFEMAFVTNLVEAARMMNTFLFVLQVFVYGFISLISLITVANIINTISTGIALRRKELAMLRSVGMAPEGFRKMVCLESLFYSLRGVIGGIPLSILVCMLMNKKLASGIIPFEVNWILYGEGIGVVLVLVGATMLYSVSRLRRVSIVDTLKEDIC